MIDGALVGHEALYKHGARCRIVTKTQDKIKAVVINEGM
jgi:hypothetical protein